MVWGAVPPKLTWISSKCLKHSSSNLSYCVKYKSFQYVYLYQQIDIITSNIYQVCSLRVYTTNSSSIDSLDKMISFLAVISPKKCLVCAYKFGMIIFFQTSVFYKFKKWGKLFVLFYDIYWFLKAAICFIMKPQSPSPSSVFMYHWDF